MFNDGANIGLPGNGAIKSDMPWTRFSFEFTTREKLGEHPYLRIYSYNFNGVIWVDALTLEKKQNQ